MRQPQREILKPPLQLGLRISRKFEKKKKKAAKDKKKTGSENLKKTDLQKKKISWASVNKSLI